MDETKYRKFTNGKIKRIIVSGILNIILENKIEGRDNLINKIWKHNFLHGYIVLPDMGLLLV